MLNCRSMKIQIDQSGKIEQTNKDTILCISNSDWDSILISARIKRQMQRMFRSEGLVRMYVLLTFSAGLALLIKRNNLYQIITVDKEYYGHEKTILSMIHTMIGAIEKVPRIEFALIGKKALAHHRAYAVAVKKLKPGKRVTFEELYSQIKKTEVGKRLKNA